MLLTLLGWFRTWSTRSPGDLLRLCLWGRSRGQINCESTSHSQMATWEFWEPYGPDETVWYYIQMYECKKNVKTTEKNHPLEEFPSVFRLPNHWPGGFACLVCRHRDPAKELSKSGPRCSTKRDEETDGQTTIFGPSCLYEESLSRFISIIFDSKLHAESEMLYLVLFAYALACRREVRLCHPIVL